MKFWITVYLQHHILYLQFMNVPYKQYSNCLEKRKKSRQCLQVDHLKSCLIQVKRNIKACFMRVFYVT